MPPEGSIIIEPVENGWLVLYFEPEVEEPDDDIDDSSDELPSYDPSAEFARAQRPSGMPQVIAHMHMHEHAKPPKKFIFVDHVALIEFVAGRTRPS